jgi:hypothetical protein
METVAVNTVGTPRREKLAGRDYIVVPMTMLVPGVLNGSKGRLYYPADEVQKKPWTWNGIPIVARHPVNAEGLALSARDPVIMEKQGLGTVYRAEASGPLAAEGWFDVERTTLFDRTLPPANQIMPKLLAGKPIELSTGLMTNDVPAPVGSTFNGSPYDFTALDYIPDHLAVLPDEVGACSIKDGCGVLVKNKLDPAALSPGDLWTRVTVNGQQSWQLAPAGPQQADATPPTPTTENQMKKTLIAWLTTNCQCWKGEQAYLEQKNEDQLKTYKTNAVAAKLALAAKSGFTANKLFTRNAEGDGGGDTAAPAGVNISDLAEFLGVTTDPAADPIGFTKEIKAKLTDILTKLTDSADPEDAPPPAGDGGADEAAEMAGAAPTGNRAGGKPGKPASPPTEQQWLANMPAAFRPVWNNAVNLDKQARQQLVDRIVTHNSGGNAQLKPQLNAIYGAMTLPQLQTIAAALPMAQAAQMPAFGQPNYGGAAVPLPTGNGFSGQPSDDMADDVLPLPTMNWSQMAGGNRGSRNNSNN